MAARIYPLSGIRYWYCYEIEEICALYKACNLHPQTVRQWIKSGMPTVDAGKPTLVHGHALKQFLGKQNNRHKCSTTFEQMYCLKCREAKPPFQKRIALQQVQRTVMAKALCQTCKTIMNKSYSLDAIPNLRSQFRVGDVSQLYDNEACPVNTHMQDSTPKQASELLQWELF